MKNSTKSLGLLVVVLGAVVAFASWMLHGGESHPESGAPPPESTAHSEQPALAPVATPSQPTAPQRSEEPAKNDVPAPAVAESKFPTSEFVAGVVVDPSGRAVANAEVTFGAGAFPFRRPPRVRGFNFAGNAPAQPEPVKTRTAQDGTFRLAKVPRVDGLELRVDHPDFVLLTRNDLIVPSSGLDVGRIQLEPGGTVSGQVFDPAGAKLPGAEVSLRDPPDTNRKNWFDFRMFGARSDRKAVTDVEGRFHLTGMPKGRSIVAATHEAMCEATSAPIDVVPQQEVGGVVLTLERGDVVKGVVHDSAGKPVAGATVRADTGNGFGSLQRFVAGENEIKSGADGRFAIPGLKPGVYEVSAEAAGFAPKSVPGVQSASSEPVEIVLGASAHIAGKVRVKGSGELAHNVKVQLVPYWGDNSYAPSTLDFNDEQNRATVDGEFLITDVNPGQFRVAARGDGTTRAVSSPIKVEEGAVVDGVEIEVERGAAVLGRVFGPSGEPLAGVDVTCSVQRASTPDASPTSARAVRGVTRMVRGFVGGGGRGRFDPTRQAVGRAKSDAEGKFQIEQLSAGTYVLDATHSDFADARVDSVEVAAGATKEGVDVHLRHGGAVEGSIVGLDGKPRAGDRVDVESKVLEGVSRSAVSDANGNYRVEHVPAGEAVCIRTESDTGGPGGAGNVLVFTALAASSEADPGKHVVVVDDDAVRCDFSQVEKPYVEGVVTCADGPVGGATVSALPDFSKGRPLLFGAQKQTTTAADGSFRLADLDPGTWNISVRHPQGLVPVSAQVKLEAGSPLRQDFVLEGGVIEGDVLAQDKSKLAGASVTLQRTDGGGGGGAITSFTGNVQIAFSPGRGGGRSFRFGGDNSTRVDSDRDGHYRAPWVPAGKYRVTARRNGFLDAQSDEVEVAANGHVEHVDVTLAPAAMLHVTVRSKATGLVLANCPVQVESESGETDFRATDAEGIARFDNLKPGTWNVSARRDFNAEEGTKRSTACAANQTAEITVDL